MKTPETDVSCGLFVSATVLASTIGFKKLSLLSISHKRCMYTVIMSSKEASNFHWSREEIVHLIDLYRQYPCLWNVKSDQYKNRDKRVADLMSIAEELRKTRDGITTGDIKGKIEALRNHHRREMRLVEKSRKSGAGIDDVYIPRLWCFDKLSFLNDGDTIRPSLSKIDNATNDTAEKHSDHEVHMVCAPVCLTVSLSFYVL